MTIKVRYSDFTTITRIRTPDDDHDPEQIATRAVRSLDKTEAGPAGPAARGRGAQLVGRDDDDENEEELRLF